MPQSLVCVILDTSFIRIKLSGSFGQQTANDGWMDGWGFYGI